MIRLAESVPSVTVHPFFGFSFHTIQSVRMSGNGRLCIADRDLLSCVPTPIDRGISRMELSDDRADFSCSMSLPPYPWLCLRRFFAVGQKVRCISTGPCVIIGAKGGYSTGDKIKHISRRKNVTATLKRSTQSSNGVWQRMSSRTFLPADERRFKLSSRICSTMKSSCATMAIRLNGRLNKRELPRVLSRAFTLL